MTSFAAIAALIAAAAYAVLCGLILVAPRGERVGRYLIAASAATSVWFGAVALRYLADESQPVASVLVFYLELARDGLWLLLLVRLLHGVGDAVYRARVRLAAAALLLLLLACGVLAVAPGLLGPQVGLGAEQARRLLLGGMLFVPLGGLLLTEQLFRNSTRDGRWALKHLYFGLGLVFAYDFYLYADALLFNRVDVVIWSARGLVNAVAVPMLAISISRKREWNLDIFVSRRVVFHGVSLAAAGAYLLTMAAAGYYIQVFGGEWGRALKAAFFSAAVLVLLSLFFSSQVRSRIRLFLARNFYRNKYEYGEEWLKFTDALSRAERDPQTLNHTILSIVADMVDSPGGVLLELNSAGRYSVAAQVSVYEGCDGELAAADAFVRALSSSARPWSLEELDPQLLATLPAWLRALPRVDLIVPILHREALLAFLVLARPRSNQSLDVEDLNLLRTVSRQAAGYLALVRATDELSEARQFETFNRLSAYLVHDLKNVVAQLSLIVRNAERHRGNPEFVDDALNTVGDAVDKMNRMLASLRQIDTAVADDELIDVHALARRAVEAKQDLTPAPTLDGVEEGERYVRGGRDRLLAVVEHLLQNAIEATPAEGSVSLSVAGDEREVRLCIADTGCGMDRDFINNRLFRPFDTTKGKAGMGIGAFESRQVVQSMQGRLDVESAPGEGSRFTICLPCSEPPALLRATAAT